jgi:hypothetical protein
MVISQTYLVIFFSAQAIYVHKLVRNHLTSSLSESNGIYTSGKDDFARRVQNGHFVVTSSNYCESKMPVAASCSLVSLLVSPI